MARVVGIDPPLRALAVHGLSRVVLGDAAGETEVRLAIEGYLQRGEAQRAITPLLNLGGVIARRGPVPALPYVEEAKQLADRFGVEADAWSARGVILEICAEMGRFDDVMTDARPILEWATEHQDADLRFRVLWSLAVVEIERGEPTVDLQDLADLSRRLSQEDALILAAQIELDQGDVDLARSHLIEGVANVDGTFAFKAARVCAKAGLIDLVELLAAGVPHYPSEQAASLGALAALEESRNLLVDARAHYAEAASMFKALEIAPERAYALQGLGRCLLALGRTEEGAVRLRDARTLWAQMSAMRRIAEIDELLARTSDGGSA